MAGAGAAGGGGRLVSAPERHRIEALLALRDYDVAEDLDRVGAQALEAAGQLARAVGGDDGAACVRVAAASEKYHHRSDRKVQAMEKRLFAMMQAMDDANSRASHLAAARQQLADCLEELPRGKGQPLANA